METDDGALTRRLRSFWVSTLILSSFSNLFLLLRPDGTGSVKGKPTSCVPVLLLFHIMLTSLFFFDTRPLESPRLRLSLLFCTKSPFLIRTTFPPSTPPRPSRTTWRSTPRQLRATPSLPTLEPSSGIEKVLDVSARSSIKGKEAQGRYTGPTKSQRPLDGFPPLSKIIRIFQL